MTALALTVCFLFALTLWCLGKLNERRRQREFQLAVRRWVDEIDTLAQAFSYITQATARAALGIEGLRDVFADLLDELEEEGAHAQGHR